MIRRIKSKVKTKLECIFIIRKVKLLAGSLLLVMRQEERRTLLGFQIAGCARGGRENKPLFTHELRKLDLESNGKRYIGAYNVILLSLFRQQALLGSSSQSLKE